MAAKKAQVTPKPVQVGKPEFARWKRPSDGLTYARWISACNRVSKKLLGFHAFDDSDSYDVDRMSHEPFLAGNLPKAFIEEAFAEDLARQEHDHQHQMESLDHEFSEEEGA